MGRAEAVVAAEGGAPAGDEGDVEVGSRRKRVKTDACRREVGRFILYTPVCFFVGYHVRPHLNTIYCHTSRHLLVLTHHNSLSPMCAGQGWGLRCRRDFSNLTAVRFVFRYVI